MHLLVLHGVRADAVVEGVLAFLESQLRALELFGLPGLQGVDEFADPRWLAVPAAHLKYVYELSALINPHLHELASIGLEHESFDLCDEVAAEPAGGMNLSVMQSRIVAGHLNQGQQLQLAEHLRGESMICALVLMIFLVITVREQFESGDCFRIAALDVAHG